MLTKDNRSVTINEKTVLKYIITDIYDKRSINLLPFLDLINVSPFPKTIRYRFTLNSTGTKVTLFIETERYYCDLNNLFKYTTHMINKLNAKMVMRTMQHVKYCVDMTILELVLLASKNFLPIDIKPSNVFINVRKGGLDVMLGDNEFTVRSTGQSCYTSYILKYPSFELSDNNEKITSDYTYYYCLRKLIYRFVQMTKNTYKDRKCVEYLDKLYPEEGDDILEYCKKKIISCKKFLVYRKYDSVQLDSISERIKLLVFMNNYKEREIVSLENGKILMTGDIESNCNELITNKILYVNSLTNIPLTNMEQYPSIDIKSIGTLLCKLNKLYTNTKSSLYHKFI